MAKAQISSVGSRIYSFIKKPLVIICLLLFIVLVWKKTDWLPSPSGWFSPKPVFIDNTPLVITEIRNIAELHTARLYAELVIDSTEAERGSFTSRVIRDIFLFPVRPPQALATPKQLVLIVRGTVIAGIDLKGLQASDIVVVKDSVYISLPEAVLLETITNPGDFEVFLEEGIWSEQEVLAVKQKARSQLQAEAMRRNLQGQAAQKAIQVMTSFLEASGFKKIVVEIKNQ